MIQRLLLRLCAGLLYIWVLLTVAAFYFFPVFLDVHATHARTSPGHLPWVGIFLAVGIMPIQGLAWSAGGDERLRRWVPGNYCQPLRIALLAGHLWAIFLLWNPSGNVIWDAGFAWARLIYFVYWIAAGISAYSLGIGDLGLGYFSGCAQLLGYAGRSPSQEDRLAQESLYRYSRHPFASYLILSLWVTPVMTLDRLIWAIAMSIFGVLGVNYRERHLLQDFGPSYREYQAEVPKWIPFV